MFFRTMGKKFFFPFFGMFIFDVFRAFKNFFRSFFLFVFVLATGQIIRPTNTIFGMQAHYDIERAKKKFCSQVQCDLWPIQRQRGKIKSNQNSKKLSENSCFKIDKKKVKKNHKVIFLTLWTSKFLNLLYLFGLFGRLQIAFN